jgi:outer membrane protein assembly factor BamB
MADSTIEELRNSLDLGLGIVSRVWDYRTKDWVTSIFADDIDGDGLFEIIACSRDGRMHLLSQEGDLHWKRIIGTKAWVSAVVVSDLPTGGSEASAHIIVGTRDGKVFVLDKDGKTLSKGGGTFSYDTNGRAFDQDREKESYRYDLGYTIRCITVDQHLPSGILMGSEDRCAYGLDYETGESLWNFQTNGWVRTISACDIDKDGQNEILVGSADGYVYLLDQQGHLLNKHRLEDSIYAILATDVDQDEHIELLVTTEGNELIALVYHKNQEHSRGYFEKKWSRTFNTRLLSFCVTDIDGDGHVEIIASSDDKYIYILDAQGNTIWRHNHKYRVFSIFPHDIDNDGLPELLVGSEHDRIRAMRIRLRRGLEKKILWYHQLLGKPDPAMITELTANQRGLLQDILQPNIRELVTAEQARVQTKEGIYEGALSMLLKLEQQKVESLWYKDTIRHIRTIAFHHIDTEKKREIIVGTADGTIHAFHSNGRGSWVTPLNDHILDMQTGFIYHHTQEDILACSTDDRVYILSGAKRRELQNIPMQGSLMASICLTTPTGHSDPEIVIGSENKKLSIYSSDLQTLVRTIPTEEGVRIVRAYVPSEGHDPEIVTASLGNSIYAYSWYGKRLWSYKARDHNKAICIKDINNDGKIETLVGSEDHNIHVLDSTGHLLWRYLLPHSILAIDAADAENDGEVMIFAGCADGYLYVFNNEGDLLWSYQAKDRIRALHAADIDDDGNIEIAIGSENELEYLRVVDQGQVTLLIARCWSALCEQSTARQVIEHLLNSNDPFLQAFALNKLAEQDDCTAKDFDILEKFVKDSPVEVGKALAHVTMLLYSLDPSRARTFLYQLWAESEQDVRNAFIEHIHLLINRDRELGFQYLKRASENPERIVRRMVVRKLHQLVDTSIGRSPEGRREIFRMLLAVAQDKESEWVRQEGARALAYFLSWHHQNLVIYTHLFIVKGLYLSILQHIAHTSTTPVVKNFLNAIVQMMDGLNGENAPERLLQVVRALEADPEIIYGKDLSLIYTELHRLFMLKTIDEVANYQCTLSKNQFDPKNQFALIIFEVFNALSLVSRPLKMYSKRESVQDRLDSLLEATEAIDEMLTYLAQKFAIQLMGEPISRLPNQQVFLLLLDNWRKLVLAQLNELRGKPELKAELQTKDVPNEEQVGIWLTVKNTGRNLASAVKITLLHTEDFEIVKDKTHVKEIILPQEETIVEFTLRPHCRVLDLEFEIASDDVDGKTRIETFKERLELTESNQEFRYIPNPYSTGTPTHDSKMFYGREKEMDFLRDNLIRSARSVLVLYGQRRSGKTTMLLQLSNSPDLEDHIPVLIDLQGISYYMTVDTFLYEVALAIAEAMERKNISIYSPILANFAANPFHTFNLFLSEAEKRLAGKKLILLIDEFEVLEEQVAKEKLRPEIFEYLRDVVQYRRSISFLFSGTHKITEHTKWYRSVFFQIALHYRLSHLSPEGAEDLIKKPVEGFLEYDPHALKKIRQLTADQPYLIHLICRAIVDYCNDRSKTFVTINDVNTVLHEVMETSQYHFDWLWDQINPDERMVLATIAEGGKEEGRWLSFKEIEDIYHRWEVPYKNEYILKGLRTLIDADIIIEDMQSDGRKTWLDGQKFKIPVGLTRTWLLKEHPLEQVRKEMVD